MVSLSGSIYIHFDNFEMLGLCWNASNQNSAHFIQYNGANSGYTNPVYMENLYIHGWTHVSYTGNCGSGGVCASVAAFSGYGQHPGGVIQFDVVDGADSDPYSLSWQSPGSGDGYIVQYNVIRYNGGDNSPNQCHIVHDNLFEYGYNANDGGTHSDWPMQCYGEATVSGAPNLFYNNIVRHMPYSLSSVLWQFPQPGYTDYTFNNVFDDYQQASGNYNNVCQGSCGSLVLFNNTEEGSGNPPGGCIICNGSDSSPITSVNDHWIVNGGSSPSAVFQSTSSVTESEAVYQSLSAANAQGYTVANNFSPTSATGATATASGTNETNGYCTALANSAAEAACVQGITSVSYNSTNHTVVYPAYTPVARPASGAWNVGAYQFTGSAPLPPATVTAVPH
jgi:hypothetical protein